jgi:two-component system alkaline phosphatase synthesis response regulator PhoP
MYWFICDKKGDLEILLEEFSLKGFHVAAFDKISEALAELNNHIPDAILIDADKSEIPCLEFCHKLKSNTEFQKVLLIVISSNVSEAIEEAMFDAGADEFVTKPIRKGALLKRISLRLNKPFSGQKVMYNGNGNGKSALEIDKESFTVYLNHTLVPLSRKEFELLYLMASHPGKIFTREEIFNKVWNKKHISKERTIDVHILRLRKKIGEAFISTQKGIGYRFCA